MEQKCCGLRKAGPDYRQGSKRLGARRGNPDYIYFAKQSQNTTLLQVRAMAINTLGLPSQRILVIYSYALARKAYLIPSFLQVRMLNETA